MYDELDKDVVEGDLAAHGFHITDEDDDVDGVHDDILPLKKKDDDEDEDEIFEFDDPEDDEKDFAGLE